jgi:hypothetical protein
MQRQLKDSDGGPERGPQQSTVQERYHAYVLRMLREERENETDQ